MRAALISLLLLGGCTLFDDPPDRSCKDNNDCFQAQGEVCNLVTKECEVVDAAPLLDDEELEASEALPTEVAP